MCANDSASLETITNLKRQAETVSDQGDLEKALGHLDQAEQLAQEADDRAIMGLVWRGRANVWFRHNQYEASFAASQKAVAVYEKQGTPFDIALAKIIQVFILGTWGQFDGAIALADWIRPHFEDYSFYQALLAANLASVYSWNWQYEKAIDTFQQAWHLFEELNMPLRAARVLHNIGVTARRMDNLDLAYDCFTRAYPQYVAAKNVFSMIKTQFNLAMLCVRKNQLQEAMAHLAQARTDLAQLPESQDVAYVDLFEARVRRALNQPQEAERLLRQALPLFEQLGWQLDVAETQIELGQLLAEGRTLAKQSEGLTYLEQSEAHLEHLKVPLLVSSVRLSKAEILLRLNRKEEAAVQAQQAYEMFTATGLHIRAAQAKIALADSCQQVEPDKAKVYYQDALETVGETIPLLAVRCLRGLGQLARAEADFLAAERAYRQAVDMLDGIRRSLSSHQNQAGFLEDKQSITRELLATIHKQSGQVEKILTWVERFKAMALADLLIRQPLDHNTDTKLQALIVEREDISAALDRHWSDLTAQDGRSLSELSQRGPIAALHDNHQVEAVSSLTRRLKVLDEHIVHYGDNAYAWRDGETIDSGNIHALLDKQTVLVSYYETDEHLYALSVTKEPGDIQVHPLPAALGKVARQWQQTRRRVMRPGSDPADVQQRLGQLWQVLIAPLEARFQDKERLLILPHRHLFHVPFACLYNRQRQKYLVETWQLQQAPSATIWAYCRQRPTGKNPPLFIGYSGVRGQANYLDAVSGEVEDLAQLWPQASVLIDEEATRARFWVAAPDCAIIHLAGHIHYDGADPLASGMPLADGRWLRASDLYLRYGQLAGATVVLSGCESARVGLAGSDILGLTSAFLYAGATTLVAGLWKVDDSATAVLMQAFYLALSQGQPVTQALQSAQLHLLRQPTYCHPYYWAAFTVNGASPHLA